jgi:LmbE family N-acetylglucosaminyl deacetylase
MKILISPHPDDETLFAAYTILREKPMVVIVTYSTTQDGNGDDRLLESYRAMNILGAPVCFLGIKEDELTAETLEKALGIFKGTDVVFIPEFEEEGNPQHNIVSTVGSKLFREARTYKTYSGLADRTIGKEIVPTDDELRLKQLAMACYESQMKNPDTLHYFNTTKEYV